MGPANRSLTVAALFRHRVFAVTYRAATVRERSSRTCFPRSVEHPIDQADVRKVWDLLKRLNRG